MASRKFDFGKLKRSFYTTTLKDGTVLVVNMPEKRVFERMQSITEVEEDEDIKYNDRDGSGRERKGGKFSYETVRHKRGRSI